MKTVPRSSLCQLETVTGAHLKRYEVMVNHPGYSAKTREYRIWLARVVASQQQINARVEQARLARRQATMLAELAWVG